MLQHDLAAAASRENGSGINNFCIWIYVSKQAASESRMVIIPSGERNTHMYV